MGQGQRGCNGAASEKSGGTDRAGNRPREAEPTVGTAVEIIGVCGRTGGCG